MPSWTPVLRRAIVVDLPLPPSANMGYRLGLHKGRPIQFKSAALASWEQFAAFKVGKIELPKQIDLSVSVVVRVGRKAYRRADLDGALKFLIDATVGKRWDHRIVRIEATKVQSEEEGATVTVWWTAAAL